MQRLLEFRVEQVLVEHGNDGDLGGGGNIVCGFRIPRGHNHLWVHTDQRFHIRLCAEPTFTN
ncbi:hypothetical protein BUE64_05200 [Corynebacterium diphtheriae subsp. lausannense]|nr:hypothetical protein BUE64_05200 [Corynebacterium diphtheriae subsp. lausannense]